MPLRFGQPQAMTWNHRQSLKEVLRHVLFRTGNERVLLNHKRRRGLIVDHIAESSTAARFGAVYERGVWIRSGDRSEEHTSELQSLMRISYAVFCLKKKKPHKPI